MQLAPRGQTPRLEGTDVTLRALRPRDPAGVGLRAAFGGAGVDRGAAAQERLGVDLPAVVGERCQQRVGVAQVTRQCEGTVRAFLEVVAHGVDGVVQEAVALRAAGAVPRHDRVPDRDVVVDEDPAGLGTGAADRVAGHRHVRPALGPISRVLLSQ